MNQLETAKVRLRQLEPEDVELLYKWENDSNLWGCSNTTAPFSKEILRRFIENQQHSIYQTCQVRFLIECRDSGRSVGAVDLSDFDARNARAEVGIMIYGEDDRGQGYATHALDALSRYSFEILHLKQLYCNIGSDNMRCINLFSRCGFEMIGLKKAWLKQAGGWGDEVMMQLLNEGS